MPSYRRSRLRLLPWLVALALPPGGAGAAGEETAADTGSGSSLVAIHDIQTPRSSSLKGRAVTIGGIVTAVTPHGFFLQAPDDEADDDPATSEGVFVSTGGAPPVAAAAGNAVRVTGSVAELVPASAGHRPVLVISGVVGVALVSAGRELPAPVAVTPADADLASPPDRIARREGMRVRIESLSVVAPTQGIVQERSATATSTGVFFGVLPGPVRPLRLRIDSAGQVGATALEVAAGSTVLDLVGTLHFTAQGYTLLPDAGGVAAISDTRAALPVTPPARDEFTVASFRMDRFFDVAGDPDRSAPVLTAAAFERRLGKASLAIRHVMRSPDVVGVDEVENLATLWALAERVNGDAVAAGEPNPVYMAFMEEGSDPAGLDVGFLVKASRAVAFDVTQEGRNATFADPKDHTASALFDRPPLVLRALVTAPRGVAAPITVVFASLRPTASRAPGSLAALARRRAQDEFLSDLVLARQADDPDVRMVLLGDVARLGGFVDLAETLPATERYSALVDGRRRELDHVLASRTLEGYVRRLDYARQGADFPESLRNDGSRPERVASHDVPVAYLRFSRADLALTKLVKPSRGPAGDLVTYTLLVTNQGPDAAVEVQVTDLLPAPVSFAAVSVPAGWSCRTPAVAATGTVTCATSALPARASATVLIAGRVSCSWPPGDVLPGVARVTAASADPDPANDDAVASSRVSAACIGH